MQGALEDLAPFAGYFGRETAAVFADLQAFSRLLHKWQSVQNLVSRETADALWGRHIVDSLQLLPAIYCDSERFGAIYQHSRSGVECVSVGSSSLNIVDIGSGGGFPALPLAIALKGWPVDVQMIESNGRKCAFLSAAAREFSLRARVHSARIEAMAPEKLGTVDIVTSRALAPLGMLLGYIAHIAPQARAILHKGREYGEEIKEADSAWAFDVVQHESRTDPEGVILEISNLRRR